MNEWMDGSTCFNSFLFNDLEDLGKVHLLLLALTTHHRTTIFDSSCLALFRVHVEIE